MLKKAKLYFVLYIKKSITLHVETLAVLERQG